MWFGFAFAAGAFLFLVVLAIVSGIAGACVDWLDAHTSHLTPAAARERARLAGLNRWPPKPARPWHTAAEWWSLVIGLSVILSMTAAYRNWSR